ncbi:uncharacterized protein LOC126888284 isoform X2 [Diabrotica virgifera virgifera]|uniref:THAP-type domain-containing protein n=1 Tax=Diabrotica virgifera virgifera TaxID=50390 RepID=A0ABM5KQA4_DIAVI|nr:uncharacterized protein LOC126888284 isoform X2 [Diabrotica virgifera virgifera]
MVRNCFVCRKTAYLHPELSFHSFPVKNQRLDMWLSIFSLNKEQITKTSMVCSEHFRKQDLIKQPSGRINLRKGALPINIYNKSPEPRSYIEVEEVDIKVPISPYDARSLNSETGEFLTRRRRLSSSSSRTQTASSESTLTASETEELLVNENIEGHGSDRELPVNKIKSELNSSASETEELLGNENIKGHGSDRELSVKKIKSELNSSASETEELLGNENIKGHALDRELPVKKIKMRKHYVGDFSISDLDSPTTRQMYIESVKQTLAKKDKQINTLFKSNRRLKKRAEKLNSLVKSLREKLSASENSVSMLLASWPEEEKEDCFSGF